MDSLHNAEGSSVEVHGVLHLELSCNITAAEIKTSNVTWILTVLRGQMDFGKEVWRWLKERVMRIMSQNKVFGLSPFFTTFMLFDLGQVI